MGGAGSAPGLPCSAMRRLSLNREILNELSTDELASVAGGTPLPTFPLDSCAFDCVHSVNPTCPLDSCVFQCGMSLAQSCLETNCCS